MSRSDGTLDAILQALLIMNQRLLLEIARDKGADGPAWIDRFRNAVATELNDAVRNSKPGDDGVPMPSMTSMIAVRTVAEIAKMAKSRLAEESAPVTAAAPSETVKD